MDNRKRKIETRGEVASAEEEQKKKQQAQPGRVQCNYCQRDISDQIYIKSALSDDVDLCLECFSVGVEIKDPRRTDSKCPHFNDCAYRVMERLDFPIITPEWTAREELSLLEGIETYGIGNWADVSVIVKSKSKKECELHYFAHYINTKPEPLIPNVSRAVSKTEFRADAAAEDLSDCVEAAVAGLGPIPGKLTWSAWKKHMLETKHVTREGIRYYDDKPTGSDIVGYMPLRQDMDIEWDNDAESLICDLSFDDRKDQEQGVAELKAKALEVYFWKLEERERRKKFLLERGLLDLKKQQKKRTGPNAKEERELYLQHRVLARFWSQEEHDEYMRSLSIERRIRRKIEQLQGFRRLGMTTFRDVTEYEEDRRRREHDDKARKHGSRGDSSSYLLPKTGTLARVDRRDRARHDDAPPNPDAPAPAPPPAAGPGAAGAAAGAGGVGKEGAVGGKKWTLEGLPGQEHLSQPEAALCNASKMVPADYLAAKSALFRASFLSTHLPPEAACAVCTAAGLDLTKALKVYELMVANGWIRAAPPPPPL